MSSNSTRYISNKALNLYINYLSLKILPVGHIFPNPLYNCKYSRL